MKVPKDADRLLSVIAALYAQRVLRDEGAYQALLATGPARKVAGWGPFGKGVAELALYGLAAEAERRAGSSGLEKALSVLLLQAAPEIAHRLRRAGAPRVLGAGRDGDLQGLLDELARELESARRGR
jgi:hypothetical protein